MFRTVTQRCKHFRNLLDDAEWLKWIKKGKKRSGICQNITGTIICLVTPVTNITKPGHLDSATFTKNILLVQKTLNILLENDNGNVVKAYFYYCLQQFDNIKIC